MQEEFEKKVRERVHTFGMAPSREVWEDIDAVLNKQKHRRVFVGWWILLGLVIIGSVVVLFDKETFNQNKLNQLPITTSDTANNHLAKILKPGKRENQFSIKPLNDTPKQKNDNIPKPLAPEEGFSNNNKIAAGRGNASNVSSINSAFSLSKKVPDISGDAQAANTASAAIKKDSMPQAVAQNTIQGQMLHTYPPGALAQAAPEPLNSGTDTASKPAEILRDTSVTALKPDKETGRNQSAVKHLKTIAKKKHEWFLLLSAGTTSTVTSGATTTPVGGNNLTAVGANPLYASIPAITALNYYNYNLSLPGTGFNISAGALYEKELSPHWKISGGLLFSYLSNTQQTGVVYKSPLYIAAGNQPYASSAFTLSYPLVTVPSYYQSGSEATLVNKAWQAEVPVSLSFVFNPKNKTKFLLNAGLSYAWLFSSQWLIPDARYEKLYYSKTVFNNTSFNWQAGPAVQLGNHWRFGLQYQQSFTTLAKDYVTPKLHWQNISIYTAIPLERKKSTGKRRGMALW